MHEVIRFAYRTGNDNVWLRRVSCTWHAADAIGCLRAADALDDWARLYALYPGWSARQAMPLAWCPDVQGTGRPATVRSRLDIRRRECSNA